MKTILQLFLVGLVILSLTNCSDDDFENIKEDLIGTWVNDTQICDTLWFNADNSFERSVGYNHGNQYGFNGTTLDTIIFIKDNFSRGLTFSLSDRGKKLTIEKFDHDRLCGTSNGTEPRENQYYSKID